MMPKQLSTAMPLLQRKHGYNGLFPETDFFLVVAIQFGNSIGNGNGFTHELEWCIDRIFNMQPDLPGCNSEQ
jgi:hypothetical protein